MTQENRFDAIQASLTALKAIKDPVVQAEAEKLEKNVKSIIDTTKPVVVAYAEQLKAFDQGLLAKYGVAAARLIEFSMIALVAAKLFLLG